MKRRKNAVYAGQSKRASTDTGDNRLLVDAFYSMLNAHLRPEDEIEIISPEQVNPTRDLQDQVYIIADYCVRHILPEVTSLFRWGDKITPRLRALALIVDQKTANDAYAVASDAERVAYAVARDAYAVAGDGVYGGVEDAVSTARAAERVALVAADAVAFDPTGAAYYGANDAARFVYHALFVVIEAGDEAAYNRIIELTNEMLEAL